MRTQLVFLAVATLLTSVAFAADTQSACDLLTASVVSSIVGTPVRIDAHPASKKSRLDACAYSGERISLTLSVRVNQTEQAARTRFAREVEQVFRTEPSPQPLRGIGTEARFGAVDGTRSGAVVARYDTTVFVLSGPYDQAMLVALTRSAIAQLDREPHRNHL